jgi:hypothetical protein
MAERLKILLSGMVAGDPHQGGATWAVLQYVAGLTRLGHEVLLVEPLAPDGDADPLAEGSETLAYFQALPLLEGRAALLLAGTEQTAGLPYSELVGFAAGADLLLNISGMLRDERLLDPIPVRAFLDLDPGFNQVWHETGADVGLDLHTHFVTVGQCLGRPGCPIPDCGRSWIPTLPPVALEHWPAEPLPPHHDAFTSVGHWRSYGSVEHGGLHYGQRAHSLRGLVDLPGRTASRFQLALGIHPDETADLEALGANRWELLDPAEVAGDPGRYAEFIRRSKAELSIVKSGYVASRSGWFSDRSACYLASGRPVVAQETGFADFLPSGEGLLAFTSVAEAAEAVAAVEAEPGRHGAAARALAEEYLDAGKVLPRLLDQLGATSTRALGSALADVGGTLAREFRRRPSPYRTSFPLEELEVAEEDGTRLKLAWKRMAWSELGEHARLAKPRFLHDPRREPAVYASVLEPAGLGAPRYRGSVIDPERDRYWLFVEWVEGRELYQVGERALWEEAARWLARMHAELGGEVERHAAAGRLLDHDAYYYRRWMQRAREFSRVAGQPASRARAVDRLGEHHDAVVEALLALPKTVIHGEFYASNVLVDAAAEPPRVAPVDWELAATGPGQTDLAALVSGDWTADDRAAIAAAYGAAGGSLEGLDYARLQLAIQWLGWAPAAWTPPEGQRHDWLGEAVALSAGLGL